LSKPTSAKLVNSLLTVFVMFCRRCDGLGSGIVVVPTGRPLHLGGLLIL